ncbi:MAG: fasciclin domain-containing protein [Syntrophobacterales bacterium]|jgi:uncharacterized surface protein with fasciclin (FAS1) repeats
MKIQMKTTLAIVAACILGIAAVTGTYAGHYGYGKMYSMDLVHTAYKSNLKTLVTAIDAAGLTETLMTGGPFTIFAPTDEAFAALPEGTLEDLLKPENKDTLANILTYHVVPGKVMAYEVLKLRSAATVNGEEVTITNDEGIKVDDANVTRFDIIAKNGVIHTIDKVMIPNS